MLILAMRAFFLLSLFAFLGTHGRILPEDISKISSDNNHGRTSILDRVRRTHHPPPPPPQVEPPVRPGCLKSIPYVTGNPQDKIITKPIHPSPPTPHIAPRHHPVTSISYVPYDKMIQLRRSTGKPYHSPPPPPHIAPRPRSSYDELLGYSKTTYAYCATGSLCNRIVMAAAI